MESSKGDPETIGSKQPKELQPLPVFPYVYPELHLLWAQTNPTCCLNCKKETGRGCPFYGVRDFCVSAKGVPGTEVGGGCLVLGQHSRGFYLRWTGLTTGPVPLPMSPVAPVSHMDQVRL